MTRLEAFHKPFEPTQIEEELRNFWEKNKFNRGVRSDSKEAYTIVMPPPNITGDLHMGHMLNNTIQDILIRWNRAMGKAACWIPGTDHASIATEAKVTAMLKEQGIDKKQIGREKFLEHCWEWKEKYGNRIVTLLKKLGISCDWDRQAFTMDEGYAKAVIQSFVKLYDEGLVYRGHRLVNWCPVSQSVISDEEVNNEERNGSLWHIRYQVENDPSLSITVATTRPETLFGDLAVAVHPDDVRYKHLVGKKVIVPVSGRSIPVIADSYSDMTLGTGAVKITPAHDMNDFEVGKRHNLGLLNIMNPDASLNDKVPEGYQGLDRYVARKKLVSELETIGALEKIVPHKLVIGISERGNVPIEYYLSEQWYFKMQSLAEKALDATRSKRLTLRPAHTEKVWEHWLTNIQDWCVSRQLWWGHQIPVYTCGSCKNVMCAEERPRKCTKCGSESLTQDPDVLDTWASAWLWPTAVHTAAKTPEEAQKDLEFFYPTATIVTGPDIIFFWIARMVMAGEHFTKKTPFKDVFFTPIVRDAKGRKMSKSLGNFPDTDKLIEKYGTDALRFSLINQTVPGQDIHWADESCDIGRNFANKIWNATRFLLMNCEKFGVNVSEVSSFDLLDKKASDPLLSWVTSEFFDAARKSHQGIENFEFAQYSSALYEFVWMIYCDWFVELIKPRLVDDANQEIAKVTLAFALQIHDGILRLLHPLMPYLTEDIWQKLSETRKDKTIGNETLPKIESSLIDTRAIKTMREIQSVVNAVRTLRGQFSIHPGTELQVTLGQKREHFGDMVPMMEFLAKAKFEFQKAKPSYSAAALVDGTELFLDLTGLVDPSAEKSRLVKKMEKLEAGIASTQKRLSNQEFVKSAPAHILAGAQTQLDTAQKELSLLQESLNNLPA